MTQFQPLQVSAKSFTWKSKTGVSEASTLGMYPMPLILNIHSPKTDKILKFFFFEKHVNVANEVEWWSYASQDGITVKIFND